MVINDNFKVIFLVFLIIYSFNYSKGTHQSFNSHSILSLKALQAIHFR